MKRVCIYVTRACARACIAYVTELVTFRFRVSTGNYTDIKPVWNKNFVATTLRFPEFSIGVSNRRLLNLSVSIYVRQSILGYDP